MGKTEVLADEWAIVWNPKKGFSMLVPEEEWESSDTPAEGLALLKIFTTMKNPDFVKELAQAGREEQLKPERE